MKRKTFTVAVQLDVSAAPNKPSADDVRAAVLKVLENRFGITMVWAVKRGRVEVFAP